MRIESSQVDSFRRSRLVRAVLFAIGALLIFAFASFWLAIGVVAMFVAEQYPIINGLLFIVLGGLIPGSGGALLAWRAVVHTRRLGHMRRLVAALSSGTILDLPALAASMGASGSVARATAFEAIHAGVIEGEDVMTLTSSAQGFAVSGPSAAGGSQAVAPTVAEVRAESAPEWAGPLHMWVGRALQDTWHMEAMIGQGGMGAVFRARHLRTGRRYALKVMLPTAEVSPEALHRFEREATAASGLGHPSIVAVHDFGRTRDGVAYLIMDLLEGETLKQRLERHGMLPWDQARAVAVEIGDALATAHEAGLLHRDVKPSNIFFARDPRGERAVLLDFGLVKRMGSGVVSRVTATGAAVGTPLYMSPEQARGETLDFRSDQYALAVVVFETVVGVPPFFDQSLAAVHARLLREEAPLASSIAPAACPGGFDQVLRRALAMRPEDRYGSVRELVAALETVGAASQTRGRTVVV